MASQQTGNSKKINAALNIVAGILFLAAGFNWLTGQDGINWMALIAGIIFMIGGIWGFVHR